ncbi:hypothetical protein PAECIP111891_03174 [Paenibacillus allorhizoplanae]|uniref:HTH cro/C1-type domain-containing protein n=1 Tax=Paenibacillus allorhizoplanae TaxID=2905648 RepID=A0ABN8GMJ0_9BACL|nr:helix-turn-helix transcriptional regulator [Paenibacillus allorhizoplanae]CAH1208197.1 hypothetical protein PAECIP111891_03174 [Paenibacillus allorhizoplanae]
MTGLLKFEIGKQIKALRTAKKLTQTQLGEMAELPYTYIGGIERGERNLSIDTLEKIILALDVSPIEVFRFIEINGQQPENNDKDEELYNFMALMSSNSYEDIKFFHKLAADILKHTTKK